MRSNRMLAFTLTAVFATAMASAQFVNLTNHVSITNTIPPVIGFVDISTTGLPLPSVDDDTVTHVILVPGLHNPFFPAGPNGDYFVSNNGVVMTGGTTAQISGSNTTTLGGGGLPVGLSGDGDHFLLPYWDNLLPGDPVPSNTTIYVQFFANVLIIMWRAESHISLASPSETITFEVQIFDKNAFPSCDTHVQYLYQDTTFGAAGAALALSGGGGATIGYQGNLGAFPWSFNSTSAVQAGTCLTLRHSGPGTLSASSPFGASSLQVDYVPACLCDFRLLAFTFNHGAFPNGWLFGVDIPLNELATELNIGAPYTGSGAAFTLGPFFGLPHITFYAVVVGLKNGQLLGGSNAIMYTIP